MTPRRNVEASVGRPTSRSDAAASSTWPSGHVEHDDVLAVRAAQRARAEPVGDVGDGDHLVAGEAAAERGRAQVVEARPAPAGGRRGGRGADRRDRPGRPMSAATRPSRCSTSARSRSTPHSSTRNLIRARVRLVRLPSSRKISVIAAAHVGRLLGQHEHVEPPAHAGRRAQAAADPDVVAHDPVLLDRDEPDVVDLVLRAAVQAPRHRHLELAREVREAAVADERALELLDQRARVDELVPVDARRAGSRPRFATRRRRPA